MVGFRRAHAREKKAPFVITAVDRQADTITVKPFDLEEEEVDGVVDDGNPQEHWVVLSASEVSDSFTVQVVVERIILSHEDMLDPMSSKEARLELLKSETRIALAKLFAANTDHACADTSTRGTKLR